MSLRIGMDIDGVMADWTEGWVRAFNREFGAHHPHVTSAQVTSWNANLDLTPFEDQGAFFAWLQTIPDFWVNLPSYPGAVMAVRDLKAAGHTVDFVTHRPDWAHEATRRWLDARGLLDGSQLIFESDKGVTGHDVYVDDAPHVLQKLEAAGIAAIRFYRPWNEDATEHCAFDWDDVLELLADLEHDLNAFPDEPRGITKDYHVVENGFFTGEVIPAPDGKGEVRIVDPKSGGEKGQKLARFDLLPPDALEAVATHFGLGARKYADRNWEKGYAWGLSYGAALRHLNLFWAGEDFDNDPSLGQPSPHLAAAAFHILALLAFQARGIGTDDRAHL